MKKIIVLLAIAFIGINANAQMMKAEDLEDYAVGKYGDSWTEAAENLRAHVELDKNHSLTYVQVVECPGKSKEDLYVALNYWFTASFNDAKSVISLNDKDTGVIMAKGYIGGIAGHTGGVNSYVVDIEPVIRVDIKDGKVRVLYTVQCYNVTKYAGGGILGSINGDSGKRMDQKWEIDNTFPFVKKDGYKAKKSSSKAFVMTHAYSNALIDMIEESISHGITGVDGGGDDW